MTRGKGRGFASMSPEQRREASRQGGLAVQEYGTGHVFTREEAKRAGAKGNSGRVPEKVVQAQIRQALLAVGAAVYTIGRPPRRDAVFKGTGQTPGIPDLYVLLPDSRVGGLAGRMQRCAHGLWIEVKAKGGTLRPGQAEFARYCAQAEIPHLVGGLDEVLAYLQAHGYVREVAHYRVGGVG